MKFLKFSWQWISGIVGNDPKMRPLIFAVIILFLGTAAYCSKAHSAELHLEVGVSAIHGTGPYLGLSYRFGGSKTLYAETDFQFWGKTTKYENATIPNNWCPSALMDVQKGRFSMGLGVAYLQLTDRLDGSHLNIALKTEWQLTDRFGVVVRHISNAGTVAPNVGRNSIALDWRLQ